MKTAIVTGASRGLGLSLVQKLNQDGYKVFALSRTKKYWKEAQAVLPKDKTVVFHQADLTRESEVKKFFACLKRQTKSVEILINNASIGGNLLRTEDLSLKEFRQVLETNLTSAFLMSKHIIPLLRKQGSGLVINISSMAGQRAVPRLFAYSASKYGVIALSQCLAKENADKNIKVITVCPGGMNTKMRLDLFGKEDAAKQQSAEFVADLVMQIIHGKIEVESGGDIVIRHGQITAIHPCPGK